jgi:hypothetical protein
MKSGQPARITGAFPRIDAVVMKVLSASELVVIAGQSGGTAPS